jgi:hypothetical protein
MRCRYGVMKDKELKFEEIEVSHCNTHIPRWTRGRSCPGEREVERMHILLCYTIHYSHMVVQKETRDLVGHCHKEPRT